MKYHNKPAISIHKLEVASRRMATVLGILWSPYHSNFQVSLLSTLMAGFRVCKRRRDIVISLQLTGPRRVFLFFGLFVHKLCALFIPIPRSGRQSNKPAGQLHAQRLFAVHRPCCRRQIIPSNSHQLPPRARAIAAAMARLVPTSCPTHSTSRSHTRCCASCELYFRSCAWFASQWWRVARRLGLRYTTGICGDLCFCVCRSRCAYRSANNMEPHETACHLLDIYPFYWARKLESLFYKSVDYHLFADTSIIFAKDNVIQWWWRLNLGDGCVYRVLCGFLGRSHRRVGQRQAARVHSVRWWALISLYFILCIYQLCAALLDHRRRKVSMSADLINKTWFYIFRHTLNIRAVCKCAILIGRSSSLCVC